jgi:hypothetical protein
MKKIKDIILRKPLLFLLLSLGYLAIVGFFKWNTHPEAGTALFAAGGITGVYFLDIAEVFFNLAPSPFRSVVFAALFALVGLFIVTSSGSMFAGGLVLSLYLTLILWQIGEWEIQKNLTSWYRMISGPVNTQIQIWILLGFIGLFIVETLLFIHW